MVDDEPSAADLYEDWPNSCPVCHGARTVQPDRNSPPEPCPRCVDPDQGEQPDAERLTLEACVCGDCFDCPDGWHYGDDLPCSCTPDCASPEAGARAERVAGFVDLLEAATHRPVVVAHFMGCTAPCSCGELDSVIAAEADDQDEEPF